MISAVPRILFIRLKLGTLWSKSSAYAAFPTRGAPKTTVRILTSDGNFRAIDNASSSANAPPSECPTWFFRNRSFTLNSFKCSGYQKIKIILQRWCSSCSSQPWAFRLRWWCPEQWPHVHRETQSVPLLPTLHQETAMYPIRPIWHWHRSKTQHWRDTRSSKSRDYYY